MYLRAIVRLRMRPDVSEGRLRASGFRIGWG